MLFKSKQGKTAKESGSKKRIDKDDLYPVLHVAGSVKECQKEIVNKEVNALQALGKVNDSFNKALDESNNFKQKLDDFEQVFSSIGQVSGQFENVKNEISESVVSVQNEVESLKEQTVQVESHFGEMDKTFGDFLESIKQIKSCTGQITSIADQTNILALNASIEAARAGEAGRGFAVVASNIRQLSDSSKSSVASAKENDELIKTAIGEISNVIEKFNATITELLQSVEGAIVNVNQTSENGRIIQESMDTVSKMADNVKEVIHETNAILN